MIHYPVVTRVCIAAIVLASLFALSLSTASPVLAQDPTCTQPDDTDLAFTFCDAAYDDLAGNYTAPLVDVHTNGQIPPVILKAIGWYETQTSPIGGWAQCVDETPFSSASGCDWGIMQINSGMNCSAPQEQFNTETQQQVKYDADYNIAMGAKILHQKWDWHKQNGRIIGDGSAEIAEHWYYATWAYNQWTADNSPHPAMNPCPNWPTSWSGCAYQDRVWWTAANPPARGGRSLWSAVNLTRPDPVAIEFPETQAEMDIWTNWHIAAPLPVHRDSCRNYLPIVMKNWIGVPCEDYTTLWYPVGTNTCNPAKSNCAEGDGQPDGNWAGEFNLNESHQVEFFPQLIRPETTVGTYWKKYSGDYAHLYTYIKVDDVWVNVHINQYQGSGTPVWRWTNPGIGQYAGQYISGIRFTAKPSNMIAGMKLIIDGYRIRNFMACDN